MAMIALSDTPRRIAELSKDGSTPTYGQIYRAALSGLVPIVKIGHRYFASEDRLAEIAGYFHVQLKGAKPARK